MERKQFMKTLALTALTTSLLSFKDVSKEKDCLDFDLSHYKFSDDELKLSQYTFSGYRVLKTNTEVPQGTLIYQKTVNIDDKTVSEVWSIVNEGYQQTHSKYYSLNKDKKSFKDFAADISMEISLPLN